MIANALVRKTESHFETTYDEIQTLVTTLDMQNS
jgi:hypothetical protein